MNQFLIKVAIYYKEYIKMLRSSNIFHCVVILGCAFYLSFVKRVAFNDLQAKLKCMTYLTLLNVYIQGYS